MRCPATCVHRVPGSWRFECARGREKPAFLFKLSRRPQQLSIKVVAWKSLQLLYSNQISSWKLWHLQKEIALPTLSWLNENDCFQLAYLDFGCHKMLEIHIHMDVLPFKREWLLLRPTPRWDQRRTGDRTSRCKMATMTTLRATTWMSPACRFLWKAKRLAGNIFRGVWGNKQKQANIYPLCSNPFCKWFWSGFWVPKHLLTGYLEH